jgi:chorismate dehydratase
MRIGSVPYLNARPLVDSLENDANDATGLPTESQEKRNDATGLPTESQVKRDDVNDVAGSSHAEWPEEQFPKTRPREEMGDVAGFTITESSRKPPTKTPPLEIVYDTPSRLATALRLGKLEAAMVSSYELLLRPGLQMAPDISISSVGRVMSVRLLSKKPMEEIETLALDQSSLTSTHLAQLLLAEIYSSWPMVSSLPPDPMAMLAQNDACVLIGDIGMFAPSDGLQVLDLGQAWHELTGLPFVWAAWIGENLDPALCSLLLDAKESGTSRLVQLAEQHATEHGWDRGLCVEYLTEVMNYDLTPEHLQGLELFQTLCIKHGLLEYQYPISVAAQSASLV